MPEKIAANYTRRTEITHVVTRGSEFDLHLPVSSLKSTNKKPTIASAAFWNSLPVHLKRLKNKNQFKKQLKQYLIEKY